MKKEKWKPVVYSKVSYKGLYEVSTMGRVRSVDRLSRKGERQLKGRVKKITQHKNGYTCVGLRKDGVTKIFYVHCLVYETFNSYIGTDLCVDHINSIKTDNRLDNLQGVTYKFNSSKEWHQLRGLPTGVRKTKKGYYVAFSTYGIGRKTIGLGNYIDKEEAIKVQRMADDLFIKQNKTLVEIKIKINKYRLLNGYSELKNCKPKDYFLKLEKTNEENAINTNALGDDTN